jgi:hypothetical protein
VILAFYFLSFLKFHQNQIIWKTQTMLDFMYFSALSFSLFGVLFEVVDMNKKKWIPKEAWRVN